MNLKTLKNSHSVHEQLHFFIQSSYRREEAQKPFMVFGTHQTKVSCNIAQPLGPRSRYLSRWPRQKLQITGDNCFFFCRWYTWGSERDVLQLWWHCYHSFSDTPRVVTSRYLLRICFYLLWTFLIFFFFLLFSFLLVLALREAEADILLMTVFCSSRRRARWPCSASMVRNVDTNGS